MNLEIEILSRREREVMNILNRRNVATAKEIMSDMAKPPTYSSVRSILRILVEKGHLKRQKSGRLYVYETVLERKSAVQAALRHLLGTFFKGSVEEAVTTLLNQSDRALDDDQIERLTTIIRSKSKRRKDAS